MDFTLDDEQKALRNMVRTLLHGSYGDLEHRRAVTAKTPGYDKRLYGELAELGLLGLAVSSVFGGSDAGPVEVGVVAKEVGRALAPEPFLTSAVLATEVVRTIGSVEHQQELLPAMCGGEMMVSWAHHEPGQRWRDVATSVRATVDGDLWVLNGTKEPVPLGADVDLLLVSAALTDGRTGVFVVRSTADGLHRHGYETPGAGRLARIDFRDAVATPLGEDVRVDEDAIARVSALTAVMAGQEAVGAMEKVLKMTTTYLTQRQQFGTTLNSFQALTFRAADMYVEVELAESLVQWATMVAADDPDQLVDAAARVSARVGRAARHVAQEAIQLHGGIGMTAEHPVGAYAQRLTALAQLVGTPDHHLSKLATHIHSYGALDPLG
ncbi:acyl-CoA dehydrogenase [Nocardioides eburneiflavus]|uniref:Acyl-CoA dehydrogenase n=1 Tax=Nocardioides eburneiflavus TaxID=2518372 RepID=A0A4Z1CKU7_9ACTN|nr:acyl-CoA dehydrogenase [Nocardioides eburneiflavus]TGN65050.1 acyl-CoA dehydrogenase [Nocardioides eburneiflavus]